MKNVQLEKRITGLFICDCVKPMGQILKTIRLLRQEAERRIENIIAGVGRGIYSELPVWLLRQRLQGEGREARRFEI